MFARFQACASNALCCSSKAELAQNLDIAIGVQSSPVLVDEAGAPRVRQEVIIGRRRLHESFQEENDARELSEADSSNGEASIPESVVIEMPLELNDAAHLSHVIGKETPRPRCSSCDPMIDDDASISVGDCADSIATERPFVMRTSFGSTSTEYDAQGSLVVKKMDWLPDKLRKARHQANVRQRRMRLPTAVGGLFLLLGFGLFIRRGLRGAETLRTESYEKLRLQLIWLCFASCCGVSGFLLFNFALLPHDRRAVRLAALVYCIIGASGVVMAVFAHGPTYDQFEAFKDAMQYLHDDVCGPLFRCWYFAYCNGIQCLCAIGICIPSARLLVRSGRHWSRDTVIFSELWCWCGSILAMLGLTIFAMATGSPLAVKRTSYFFLVIPLMIACVPFAAGAYLALFGATYRNRVQSWLLSRGGASVTAAGIAELLGGRGVANVLDIARRTFSSIRADLLTFDAMSDSTLHTEEPGLAEPSHLGFVDAFLSHSWHDDPRLKWKGLQRFRTHFKARHGREPTLWIDKYCIDQENAEESLAALPVYLSGCRKLVILCGDTYLRRLWCLIEIFIFLEMGGSQDNLEIYTLGEVDDAHALLKDFKVSSARCFDPEDEKCLRSVIQVNEEGVESIIQSAFEHQAGKQAMQRVGSCESFIENIMSSTSCETFHAAEAQPINVPVAPPPAWLPRAGVGQRHVAPEMWALDVNQWLSFVRACEETLSWTALATLKGRIDVYDICTHFVKPWCRNTGNSVALLMNPIPRKAELMVSHSWGEDVNECGEALSLFCLSHRVPKTTCMFFCTFSIYQPDDDHIHGLSIQDQLKLDPFKAVIGKQPAFGMIVVHTTTVDVYTRMWCVYEIDEALTANVKVQGVMSLAFMNKYLSRHVADALVALRTETARCARKSDEDEIREAVHAKGGFARLDAVILRFRRHMLDMSQPSYKCATFSL